jgi:hypothetical protein
MKIAVSGKKIYAPLIFLFAHLGSFWYVCLSTYNYGKLGGELQDAVLATLPFSTILLICLLQSLLAVGITVVYLSSNQDQAPYPRLLHLLRQNELVILAYATTSNIFLIFSIATASGSSNHELTLKLLAFLDPGVLLPFYYFYARERLSPLRICNIFLLLFAVLLSGWTGIIVVLFYCELAFRSQKWSFKTFIKWLFLAFTCYALVCTIFYRGIFELKTLIRGQYISLDEYNPALMFVNRLSPATIALASIQEAPGIVKRYQQYNDSTPDQEIYNIFKPLLPSFLFGEKNSLSFSYYSKQFFIPLLESSTSTDLGLVSYLYLLLLHDKLTCIISLILIIFSLSIFQKFVRLIYPSSHPGHFLYFMYIASLLSFASLENFIGRSLLMFFLVWIPFFSSIGFIRNLFKTS